MNLYIHIAKLHIDEMPNAFLPLLGTKFLGYMYQCMDESDDYKLITHSEDGKLQGFVSGTLGNTNLAFLLLRNPIKLLVSLYPVLYSPKILLKILNLIMYRSNNSRKSFPDAELLTIVVGKRYSKKGIATKLYNQLCNFFKERKCFEFTIVVGSLLDANKFYKKQGAISYGTINLHGDQESYIYIQRINDDKVF